jgi:hypothetical protein
MDDYIKLYNDSFNDKCHIEKYNNCKNCYGIILDRSYCDNKSINKCLCEKCYLLLKNEKCKNCNNNVIQEKNNRMWLVQKSSCHSCLYNKVCELCKNIKIYNRYLNNEIVLNFYKRCIDCNHSIHTYHCNICNTYIDDYIEPIKCHICNEKICFTCTNKLKCEITQNNYTHIVCDNCFTSCKKKCNNKDCDRYDTPYCMANNNCYNCKKTGCSTCEIIRTSCHCFKPLCIDCHEGHQPIAQYCTSCYKTLHQCDKYDICNYCNSSWSNKKKRIAPCQTCKFSHNIQSMYTNKEHCIGCQKDLIIELCDTHRDIKSTVKWKCCSLCNDYYCKKCKDKYKVRVCKKCRHVYCNNHNSIIKNGICSDCRPNGE